jgi:hypothetical protein
MEPKLEDGLEDIKLLIPIYSLPEYYSNRRRERVGDRKTRAATWATHNKLTTTTSPSYSMKISTIAQSRNKRQAEKVLFAKP